MTSNPLFSRAWAKTLALMLIIGIGLFVRLENLSRWKTEAPNIAFHQGEPLLVRLQFWRGSSRSLWQIAKPLKIS